MEIWSFEVVPGRLFQEQRSVFNITLISYTPLRYFRNITHKELKICNTLHYFCKHAFPNAIECDKNICCGDFLCAKYMVLATIIRFHTTNVVCYH